jgi:serine/threonine-protein kinase
MASVYLARDLRHDREVAIKILRADLASGLGVGRFLREISIGATLQHPHILGLIDSGSIEPAAGFGGGKSDQSVPYYVMPYVQGETLRERLTREKQLSLADTLRLAREIADALDHAHRHGVVHRDIKPGNILLAGDHAWVADFGIARALTAAAGDEVTQAGLAVGTPEYMSPEQGSGETGIDGRSDVYSLGCLVYEMLVGEPPYRGPTAQAVLARHRHDPPPSVRVVRPNVPVGVETAVHQALAKVAADRYPTAVAFMRALEDGTGSPDPAPIGVRRPLSIGLTALAIAVAIAAWLSSRLRSSPLDPQRVVVFPLHAPEEGASEGVGGDAVATYIGYALEGSEPLKWLDGWDYLDKEHRVNIASLSTDQARSLSRRHRAAFFIDGSVIRGADSITVVLRLHDVAGDSILRRRGASAPARQASLPRLGVQAVSGLLPALLEPGRAVDLSALTDRDPSAVANFLQGEREYRRLDFGSALAHYRGAVQRDSSLALAALKGAMAASWREQLPEAEAMLGVALPRTDLLPLKYRIVARGFSAYLSGLPDSAVRELRRAIALDPAWPEAWVILGETYYHLIPRDSSSLDSLAADAFVEAHRRDSTFIPAVYHLIELAVTRGGLDTAATLLARLQAAGVDRVSRLHLELMLRCARSSRREAPWREVVSTHPTVVLAAGQALAAHGAQLDCARSAYDAALLSDTVEVRWGALLGLQGILVAQGRADAVRALLGSSAVADLPAQLLFLWNATIDSSLDQDAVRVAAARGEDYAAMPSANLWLLGQWEAHRNDTIKLARIVKVLQDRTHEGERVDSLLAAAFDAHLERLRGDTVTAIRHLRAMLPSARRADLMWQPWEALAGERLALARLLLATSSYLAAYRAAESLDDHRSVAFLPYLQPSLTIRAEAAESLGWHEVARDHRRKLSALRS